MDLNLCRKKESASKRRCLLWLVTGWKWELWREKGLKWYYCYPPNLRNREQKQFYKVLIFVFELVLFYPLPLDRGCCGLELWLVQASQCGLPFPVWKTEEGRRWERQSPLHCHCDIPWSPGWCPGQCSVHSALLEFTDRQEQRSSVGEAGLNNYT